MHYYFKGFLVFRSLRLWSSLTFFTIFWENTLDRIEKHISRGLFLNDRLNYPSKKLCRVGTAEEESEDVNRRRWGWNARRRLTRWTLPIGPTFDLFPAVEIAPVAINRHFPSTWQNVFPAALVSRSKCTILTAAFSSSSSSLPRRERRPSCISD